MKTSNTGLQSLELLYEVQETFETPAGYYCAVIPVGNVDETISAPSVGELYTRVMDFLAELRSDETEIDEMIAGFISESQHDALARAI